MTTRALPVPSTTTTMRTINKWAFILNLAAAVPDATETQTKSPFKCTQDERAWVRLLPWPARDGFHRKPESERNLTLRGGCAILAALPRAGTAAFATPFFTAGGLERPFRPTALRSPFFKGRQQPMPSRPVQRPTRRPRSLPSSTLQSRL